MPLQGASTMFGAKEQRSSSMTASRAGSFEMRTSGDAGGPSVRRGR